MSGILEAGEPWTTRAFGLPLELTLPDLAGLEPGGGRAEAPTRVGWLRATHEPEGGAVERIFVQRTPDGRTVATLHRHRGCGYVLTTPGFGRFAVSADGTSVACAPEGAAPWRWERMLLGHGLPLAAILRGVELFHASAVVLPGACAAIAIAAPSHGGKTSLAVQLARLGAGYLTDDALAVTVEDGVPMAEPGGGTASVRTAEADRIASDGRGCPGRIVARDDDCVRLVLARAERAPLRALYVVERDRGAPDLTFAQVDADPRRLLAATFNFAVRDPARLARQLDVCSAVAAAVPLVRVGVPPHADAAATARAMLEHTAAVAA